MATKCIYPNLAAELARSMTTQKQLGDRIGLDNSTISMKLTGKREITLKEAREIKAFLKVEIPIDELFAVTNNV